THAIYTLSLHDALPISRTDYTSTRWIRRCTSSFQSTMVSGKQCRPTAKNLRPPRVSGWRSEKRTERNLGSPTFSRLSSTPTQGRSEEHTSELQSLRHLV